MRNSPSVFSAKAVALLLLIAATLVCAGSTFAQTQATAADLSGTVTDPNGAVVSGAAVTARDSATGITRTVTADSDGHYSIIGLPPGEYEVSAEAANFKKVIVSGVRLTVGQAADLTLKLELGASTAVVNVSANDVQLIEPTRSSVA
ncbi:MAG: carboxypeptidase-like regulatory domain-containing protein, partial [Pyrinomonadaceae bacterium]